MVVLVGAWRFENHCPRTNRSRESLWESELHVVATFLKNKQTTILIIILLDIEVQNGGMISHDHIASW